MCKSMKFDGETFHTVRQLAAKVGTAQLVWHKGLSLDQLSADLNYCLCGLDMEAIAAGLGKVELASARDPMCREFVTDPEAGSDVARPSAAPIASPHTRVMDDRRAA